ncbi:MAG: hypothetical protein AB7S38_18395 [Vulcanimicrobiota bacterium]
MKLKDRRFHLNKRALDAWKEEERRTYKWLAAQIGVPHRTLYAHLHGYCHVTVAMLWALSEKTGIALRDLIVEVTVAA